MAIDLSDYVPVAERIVKFRTEYPDGRLISEIVDTGHADYVAVKAYVYRTPDDPRPGVGLAWEKVPGPTPFTKDSELQNAETSAWGRALIAAGVADASRGIATREDIREPAPTRTDEPDGYGTPEPPSDVGWSPGDWLRTSVEAFAKWTSDERNNAYKDAMEVLEFQRVSSMDRAKEVFERMAEAYYEDHPETGLF